MRSADIRECNALRLELRTTGTVGSGHPIPSRTPMIGDALDSPAAVELINDFRGVLQTVPLETGRRRHSARPGASLGPGGPTAPAAAAALGPGLAQAVVERAFFRPPSIRRSIELGAATTASPDRVPAINERP
jgi:hypothetical protein